MRARSARRIRRGIVLGRTSLRFISQAVQSCVEGDSYLVDIAAKFFTLNLRTSKQEHKLTEAAFLRTALRGIDEAFNHDAKKGSRGDA